MKSHGIINEPKAKLLLRCGDDLWQKLKSSHRRKYPNDKSSMNLAVIRAITEFTK